MVLWFVCIKCYLQPCGALQQHLFSRDLLIARGVCLVAAAAAAAAAGGPLAFTLAQETLLMSALQSSLLEGQPATLLATFTEGSTPVAGNNVTFTLTNAATGIVVRQVSGLSDSQGQVTLAYDGDGVAAGTTLTVTASAPSSGGGTVTGELADSSGSVPIFGLPPVLCRTRAAL
jgi:hypothetical protein